MPVINFGAREVRCKIVYWGPGLSGKTTNLEVIHKKAPKERRGELTSIATEGERTLFFDYLPLEIGEVGGMKVKFQLYTVPGQAHYQATRRLVLQGADGIVFVADSQPEKMAENLAALRDLEETFAAHSLQRERVPVVFQWNKRDMPDALPVDALDQALNPGCAPSFEAVALHGEGVFPTLRTAATLVLEQLRKEWGLEPAGKQPSGESRPPSGEKKRKSKPADPAPEPAAAPVPVEPRPPRKPARRRRPTPAPAPAPPVAEPALPARPAEPRRSASQEAPRRPLGKVLLVLTLVGFAAALWLGGRGLLPGPLQAGFDLLGR